MSATGQIVSIALLAIPAMFLLTQVGAAQRPAEQSQPALIVTPLTTIAFSGPQGGPFAPSLVEYRIRASTGTVNYSIRAPSWLTVSSNSGSVDTSGVTITLTLDASASRLRPGTYGPGIAFINVSSGRGGGTRPARLTVQGPSSPPRQTGEIARGRGGYLLDSRGGYLLDEHNGRLLAQ